MVKISDFDHIKYLANKTNYSELIEYLLWNFIVFIKFDVIRVIRLFKRIAVGVAKWV